MKKIFQLSFGLLCAISIISCTNPPPSAAVSKNSTVSGVKPADMNGNGAYANWNKNVTEGEKFVKSKGPEIKTYFNSLSRIDPAGMGKDWIKLAGKEAAAHPQFTASVKSAAGSDSKGYMKSLTSDPKKIRALNGSKEAFTLALNQINARNTGYKRLEKRFEASARGTSAPLDPALRPISAIRIEPYYSTVPGNPSVAERILIVAAANVLKMENDSDVARSLEALSENRGISGCLNLAQKNSAQCGAASYNDSDLSYCVAKHAIGEVSRCFSWILPNS